MGEVLDTTGDWSLMFAFTATSYVQPLSVPLARYHLLCLVKDAFWNNYLCRSVSQRNGQVVQRTTSPASLCIIRDSEARMSPRRCCYSAVQVANLGCSCRLCVDRLSYSLQFSSHTLPFSIRHCQKPMFRRRSLTGYVV